MGVTGLWTLLEPVSKPVPLETLGDKTLAVDVSIWLHQATKGFRDSQGNPLPNAHLLGLCHRICKLLFYKIKPIFVFDGGVPLLKRQTMALRNSRKSVSQKNQEKLAEKILTNYIQSEIVHHALNKDRKLPKLKKTVEKDLFELPPLPASTINVENNSSAVETETEESDFEDEISIHTQNQNIHTVDFTSEAFKNMPIEMQHDFLLELKETRKESSWNRIHEMPVELHDFSGFQMQRLLKRRGLQKRLDEVTAEINRNKHELLDLDDDQVAESRRLASDDSTHFVLIRKMIESASSDTKPKTDPSRNLLPAQLSVPITAKQMINLNDGADKTSPKDDKAEQVICLDDEPDQEYTQEELLAIFMNEKKTAVSTIDDDDSDLEEVPTPSVPVISVPINDGVVYKEKDDMFADIFASRPGPAISVPINDVVYKEKDDMFADIFTPRPGPVIETVEVMSSSDSETADELPRSSVSPPLVRLQPQEIPAKRRSPETVSGEVCSLPQVESVEPEILIPGEAKKLTGFEEKPAKLQERTANAHDPETSAVHLETPMKPFDDRIGLSEVNDELKKQDRDQDSKSYDEPEMNDIPDEIDYASEDIQDDNSVGFDEEVAVVQDKPVNKSDHLNPVEPSVSAVSREELTALSERLEHEQPLLIQEHGREKRMATTITDQMYLEAQELLRMFGMPYLVAPMEAEAQCAFLDQAGITDGTITDDSDIWLFGGRRVYKNFFNQGKFVERYEANDISRVFRMEREQLIELALLTGSDYTEGIESVGPVTALEILAEFPSRARLLEGLEQFRDWLTQIQQRRNAPPENKIRQKIRNLKVKPGFPSRAVVEAYLKPEVNESRAKFTWLAPDEDTLRDHLSQKIGWNRDKFNAVVVPVLSNYNAPDSQRRIDSFFSAIRFPDRTAVGVSKRVLNAIRKADFGSTEEKEDVEVTAPSSQPTPVDGQKRRKRTERTTGPSKSKISKRSPEPVASSSSASASESVIWQKEKDRQILAANKMKAIQLLRGKSAAAANHSKRPGTKKLIQAQSQAQLSDASDSS